MRITPHRSMRQLTHAGQHQCYHQSDQSSLHEQAAKKEKARKRRAKSNGAGFNQGDLHNPPQQEPFD